MKSGLIVLIGRSNVGKSTLMNTLVGTKIAATSFRAQMTRQLIHGVMNTPEGQAVFVDTPGIFKDRKDVLTAKLINKAKESLQDIDLVLYVVDPGREIGIEERAAFGLIRHIEKPKILVINKSDLPEKERLHQDQYATLSKDFDAVFLLSALRGSHIKPLKDKVMELLPEGEPLYPEEQLTNITNDYWIAEIIREKIFSVLDKEIPYSISVEIDNIEDKNDLFVIYGRILTDANRYKKIIIGSRGSKIKEIGKMARRELEQALGKKVYLDLEVVVDPHWIQRI